MGLGISVGILADLNEHDPEGAAFFREQLTVLNRYLTDQMLPLHAEPERLPPLRRQTVTSFPYRYLHHLRRVFAWALADPEWRAEPFPEHLDPAEDPLVERESYLFRSHLLCHSDAEGFYLPIAFDDPLTGDDVLGGFAGSSYQLLDELQLCATALGVHRDHGRLLPGELERLLDPDAPLLPERIAFAALQEACELSIAWGTAIAFL